jgi:uncharacterized membrane protein YbhN (UPF0104 family)
MDPSADDGPDLSRPRTSGSWGESTLGATSPAKVPAAGAAVPRASRLQILFRVVGLLVAAIAFYFLLPQLLDVWEQIPKLTSIKWWFVVILPLEAGSFACQWKLTRTALPQVSWFVAATAQLASNAIAKVVPGGAAVGGATGYRMLSVSGVNRATAGAALAATAIVSNGVLFALPMVAVLGSILTAPVPGDLAVIAWGGALLFLVLFAIVFTLVRFDRPLWAVGHLVERVSGWLLRHVIGPVRSWSSRMPVGRQHRDDGRVDDGRDDDVRVGRGVVRVGAQQEPLPIATSGPTASGFVHQRDIMVSTLGPRWRTALAAAVGNWGLDYLALVAAIYAVTGAKPKLSLILLAYGAAAVLSMIPITPGGLGFVELGLTAALVAAGIKPADALLATLAYRVVSYWLPLPAGLVASILFRRRYGRVPDPPDLGVTNATG